jgi:hypothetical protein
MFQNHRKKIFSALKTMAFSSCSTIFEHSNMIYYSITIDHNKSIRECLSALKPSFAPPEYDDCGDFNGVVDLQTPLRSRDKNFLSARTRDSRYQKFQIAEEGFPHRLAIEYFLVALYIY